MAREIDKHVVKSIHPNDYRNNYIQKQTDMSEENVEIHKLIAQQHAGDKKALNQDNLEALRKINRNVSLPDISNFRTIDQRGAEEAVS